MKSWQGLLLLLMVSLAGCGGTQYPAVSAELAKQVKSGTSLADLKQQLGEPHPPTSIQAKSLTETISRMPDPIRANAAKDESLAWGNDSSFVVVKVNKEGVAWVVSWKSGS